MSFLPVFSAHGSVVSHSADLRSWRLKFLGHFLSSLRSHATPGFHLTQCGCGGALGRAHGVAPGWHACPSFRFRSSSSSFCFFARSCSSACFLAASTSAPRPRVVMIAVAPSSGLTPTSPPVDVPGSCAPSIAASAAVLRACLSFWSAFSFFSSTGSPRMAASTTS